MHFSIFLCFCISRLFLLNIVYEIVKTAVHGKSGKHKKHKRHKYGSKHVSLKNVVKPKSLCSDESRKSREESEVCRQKQKIEKIFINYYWIYIETVHVVALEYACDYKWKSDSASLSLRGRRNEFWFWATAKTTRDKFAKDARQMI